MAAPIASAAVAAYAQAAKTAGPGIAAREEGGGFADLLKQAEGGGGGGV
jgi:hypothetical protein